MKDLGPAKLILGMKISRDRFASTLNLSQELTTPLANHFKLSKEQSPKTIEERDYMALVPYASAVGSLILTRPDITHAVGVVSRYMANPGKEYWKNVKCLLRYLRGISSTSLCFGKGKVTRQGFVDADLGGDVDSSKSTSGYIYTIGGTTVTWMSRLQKCVVLSSTEVEYVAIAEAGKEMIWLVDYLEELVHLSFVVEHDTFKLSDTQHVWDTIMDQDNKLYRYHRARLHDHFKKYATKE
uniref:Reverse transcriptase Ty1/copia-type domain-containing protein n=1 Tax=Solanum lycopersicum TaxID=4081 RepID=A0A3Q7GJ91_SOLLC